ncbi:transposase [Streptomyces sp. NBC_01014]|nr:transposase [Streptomyces sp. NBC_01014]
MVNALLYPVRTGYQWDYLPRDLPPPGAVTYYFCKWRDDGTDEVIHDLLRWQVRESRGRLADPSLVALDTQSLHAAAGVPAPTTGRDAAKKVPGRKRGLAVDVLGLVVAVVALAASVHDNAFGTALLDKVAAGTSDRAAGRTRPGRRAHHYHPQDAPGTARRNALGTGHTDSGPAGRPRLPADHGRFAEADAPLRARNMCEAMDLNLVPNNINNVRIKLKRLTGGRILDATGPGLFTSPRP